MPFLTGNSQLRMLDVMCTELDMLEKDKWGILIFWLSLNGRLGVWERSYQGLINIPKRGRRAVEYRQIDQRDILHNEMGHSFPREWSQQV